MKIIIPVYEQGNQSSQLDSIISIFQMRKQIPRG